MAKVKAEKPKKVSPISRTDFDTKAPATIPVQISTFALAGTRKQFETGSMGWNANGRVTLDIGGVPVECQVGVNVTVIGSKELPKKE